MVCCCDCRLPRSIQYIPPFLVSCMILWLYLSFIVHAQPILFRQGVTIMTILYFHIMVFLLITSLSRCILSMDSFLPINHSIKKDINEESHEQIEVKLDGSQRYCRKCISYKPDRTHHCSVCERCILKMDHHCVLINKCIGYYNYKFFLLFLWWSSMSCLYMSNLLYRYLLIASLDHTLNMFSIGQLQWTMPSLQVLLVFLLSFCLGCALFCFTMLHFYLVACNNSTLEYCEKRREYEYINYYNIGIIGNIQQVFGSVKEIYNWFLPVYPSIVNQVQGRYFPTNAKYQIKED